MSKIGRWGPGVTRPVRFMRNMAHDTPCKVCPRVVKGGGPGFWAPGIGGAHVECDKINRAWWEPFAEQSTWKY